MWFKRLLGRDRAPGANAGEGSAAAAALVVGLGNPGANYAQHRHNAGFMVIAELARRHGVSVRERKKQALLGAGTIAGRHVTLAMPQTGMNDSGKSVRALREFYKLPSERVLLVYDDLDLPFGHVRARPNGSAGGHHGLESILAQTGTLNYPRVRVGIGRPATRAEVIDFVLSPFHPREQEAAEAAIGAAADAVERWLSAGEEGLSR
ncbi:MAG TPA: aminoacyl-tRNA hydrolase [Chloroflexota bacterium]|nr:aminoacyl-tRNA hydrolase [Chloroflexota bacterium]